MQICLAQNSFCCFLVIVSSGQGWQELHVQTQAISKQIQHYSASVWIFVGSLEWNVFTLQMMCLHRCSYQLWMQPRNIVPSSECVPSALMQPMYDGCGFWQQGVFSNSTKFSALKRKTFSQQELSYWFEIFLNAMVNWKSCKLFSFRYIRTIENERNIQENTL